MTDTPTSRDESRPPRGRPPKSRDNSRSVEIDLSLDDTGPVPQDIKAREGYENQWIRVMDGNEPATRNTMVAERQGWSPVDPRTLNKSYDHMLVQTEKFGGVLGTHDLVLMERPMKYGDQQRVLLRQRVKDKTDAIKVGMRRELSGTGINYVDDSRADLELGRRAEVAPD